MGVQAPLSQQGLSRARRLGAARLVVGALVPLLAACSDDDPDVRPAAACKVPSEIEIPKGIPGDFPWPDGAFVTQAEPTKKFVTLTGFSERSVEALFETSREALVQNEFDIINTDYEGFEAELYFAKGDSLAGIAALREGPCDGYVKVNVVYDPLETAAGREAVRNTRRLSGERSTPGNP